jgi:hypothetical protein
MVSNLPLFILETVLATFQKIGQFFPNHLVTLFTRDYILGKWCPLAANTLAYFKSL